MVTSAFVLCPTTPVINTSRLTNRSSYLKFDPISLYVSKKSFDLNLIHGYSGLATHRSSPLCSSSRFSYWISDPSFGFDRRRRRDFQVEATSIPKTADESTKSSSLIQTLEIGVMFGLWTVFNIYFNIYNKQVLKVYPFPVTVSTFQFFAGTVLVILMWAFNLYKRPKVSGSQLIAIIPLALVHSLGNLFTNMSLGKVAVSFTHTIKAMEPFFTVLLSLLFLGETPSVWVVASLVPIVGGVALASLTEVSFNWAGFWSAMASNLTNQSRNVLSKKVMVKKEESIDNITLFSIITIMSFIMCLPLTLIMEGVKFTPASMQAAGLNIKEVCLRSLLAALCYHAYQQVAYMILERVSPVTHAVGNCVKRVVVIVSAVLFFQTPVSPINSLGTGVALAGVFLYSRVTQIKPKPKAA